MKITKINGYIDHAWIINAIICVNNYSHAEIKPNNVIICAEYEVISRYCVKSVFDIQ